MRSDESRSIKGKTTRSNMLIRPRTDSSVSIKVFIDVVVASHNLSARLLDLALPKLTGMCRIIVDSHTITMIPRLLGVEIVWIERATRYVKPLTEFLCIDCVFE